jgi:hypothetical protein
MTASRITSATQNGASEPPMKRQRLDPSPKPYVKNEGAGAVSPVFSSERSEVVDDDDVVVVTKSCAVKRPIPKKTRPRKSSESLPIAVNEYHSVEATMRSSPRKRSSQTEFSPHFVAKLSNGRRQPSEESDPGEFTRESKKARYEERANDRFQSSLKSHGTTQIPETTRSETTPPPLREIFTPSILPSKVVSPSHNDKHPSEIAPTAGSRSDGDHQTITRGAREGTDVDGTEIQTNRPLTTAKSVAGGKSRVGLNPATSEAITFDFRYLSFGLLPGKDSYVAAVSEDSLTIYDLESRLSTERIWSPVSLSKILKIFHGSQDCLKLILHMSKCEGQPSNKIMLELKCKEDKEKFLSLMPQAVSKTLRILKEEYALLFSFPPL